MKLTDIEVFQTKKHPGRDDFEFKVEIRDILAALESRISYHKKRIVFWRVELTRASGQLKATTKIVEQVVTGGVQHVAQVDLNASQRVSQCENKLTLHRNRLWNYEAWHYCYSHVSPEADHSQFLSVGDVQAFGLVPNPAEED